MYAFTTAYAPACCAFGVYTYRTHTRPPQAQSFWENLSLTCAQLMTDKMPSATGNDSGNAYTGEQSSSIKTASKTIKLSDSLTMRRDGYAKNIYGFCSASPSDTNPTHDALHTQNPLEKGIWNPCSDRVEAKNRDAAIANFRRFIKFIY